MMGTQDDLLRILSPKQAEYLLHDFPVWAHEPQLPPAGTWRTWLLMGGRGAGKTRAGAEWLNALAGKNRLDHSGLHFHGDSGGRVALIGETFQDARAVMIEGESGILATSRKDRRPVWHPSRKQLEWPNGTIGQVFSATDPDGLRGSQFGAAWCDDCRCCRACFRDGHFHRRSDPKRTRRYHRAVCRRGWRLACNLRTPLRHSHHHLTESVIWLIWPACQVSWRLFQDC